MGYGLLDRHAIAEGIESFISSHRSNSEAELTSLSWKNIHGFAWKRAGACDGSFRLGSKNSIVRSAPVSTTHEQHVVFEGG
jgi:hypothetical protein